ncbi:site-specific integrase [uncultured Rhodoblastus sp.]|uniref:tyrosine-type recombinase/integrase n=1 Tax=uncultured Rhodoblastus sp. TaxID=543037 RepID=UPI0025D249EA|nr:site-specific integrase [uncultured Rhodoblastus sp.]
MAKPLTNLAIEALKPGATRREIPDGKVGGLYYVLQPSGATSWALRYRHLGKPCKLTIGGGAISLPDARDLAREALGKVARGENPAASKVAEKQAAKVADKPAGDLVEKVVASFLDRYAKRQCKATTFVEYKRILEKNVVSAWRGRRLGEVTRADVHELLDGIIDRGAAVQANRTFAALRTMSNWALERGVIDRNPCNGLKAPTQETSRERVLTDEEIRLAWLAFEKVGWPFGRLGQMLLLTGARRDEIAEAKWSEFDADQKLLILPPARMKAKDAFEIPLTDKALEIIAALPKIAAKNKEPEFLFTTSGERPVSGFSKGKAHIDRIMAELVRTEQGDEAQEIPHWVFHDLRRTVATNLQKLGIRLEVTEAVLGHVSGSRSGIVGIYQRHKFADEKKAALEAWARRLDAIVSGKPAANVVELASART